MGDWQTVVQYNEEGTPPYVRDVCRAITNATLPKAPLQRLRITEVLADPLGPEPRQEFVEVQVLRGTSWDAASLWVADGRWEELRSALEAPGALGGQGRGLGGAPILEKR